MTETGTYLYAVTRDISPDRVAGIAGLGGDGVRLVEHEGLYAVVSTVDLAEFGDDALRKNLEDISWLEKVARTHDAVIQQVADHAPTAPLRLATIVFDDTGVRQRLAEWHPALVAALDRVDGRREWSVKAYSALTEDAPPGGARREQTESGTSYLKRRRAESTHREDAAQVAAAVADDVHGRLAALVVASRRLPPQDRRLTGHEGTMTLNGAYLVDEARGSEVEALVGELAVEHPTARLEVNGPWPPYSFATLEPE